MSIGSKLKKIRKKVQNIVEKGGQSYIDVVRAPVKVATAVAEGKNSTAILQEVGAAAGSAARIYSPVYTSTTGQKILASNSLNKITLGTSKEIRNVGKGFRAMEDRKTVQSSFYKSGASLTAKAFAVGATSAYLSGAKATTGAIEVTSQTTVSGATFGPAPVVTSTSLTASGTAASTLPTLGTVAKYGAGLSIAKKLLGGDVQGAAEDLGFGGLFPEDSSGESTIGGPDNTEGYTPTILGMNQNQLLLGGALLATVFVLVKKKVI